MWVAGCRRRRSDDLFDLWRRRVSSILSFPRLGLTARVTRTMRPPLGWRSHDGMEKEVTVPAGLSQLGLSTWMQDSWNTMINL